MIRTFAIATLLVSSFASTSAFAAAPAFHTVNGVEVYGKVQTIKFTLRNDSADELRLAAGDSKMTIAPGKSLSVKLPVGQKITAATDCGRFAQGDLVSTVADMMNGNTLAIR